MAEGFAPDLQVSRVHATVMRKASGALPVLVIQPLTWVFDAFVLVESQTVATGATYTVIEKWPLQLQMPDAQSASGRYP